MFAFDIVSCLLLTRVCLKIYEPAKVIDYQANKRFVALYRIINNHVLAIYFEQRVNSLSTDRSSLLLSRIFSLYRIYNLWYEIYDIRNIIIHNKSGKANNDSFISFLNLRNLLTMKSTIALKMYYSSQILLFVLLYSTILAMTILAVHWDNAI